MKHLSATGPTGSDALTITPEHRKHPHWTWLWDRLLGPIPQRTVSNSGETVNSSEGVDDDPESASS